MAKGDHDRGERRIDEQMKQAQSYLTPIQQQLGGQTAGLTNMFSGGFPQQGNVFGYGSTVPHYSPYNQPIFSGNGTDTPLNYQQGMPTNRQPAGMTQVGSSSTPDAMRNAIMPILAKYGGASSEALQRALPEIQALYPDARPDRSGGPLDELVIGGNTIDFISNAEGGGNKEWTFQTGGGSPSGSSSSGFGGGAVGRNLGDYNNIFNRYSQFADTGGYSPQDLANIRSRAISPIRSIYSSAEQGLDRQRSLQGGYSPGFSTAKARMAREQGQLTSDATTNAEAAISEMVNQGRRFGVSGMNQAYSSTPGLSNMFGNQMLQSQGQQLTAAGLQNQLSLGLIGGQQNLASVPGNFDTTLGTIGRIGGMAGGMLYPWLGGGSSAFGAAAGQPGAVKNFQQYL